MNPVRNFVCSVDGFLVERDEGNRLVSTFEQMSGFSVGLLGDVRVLTVR